MGGHGANCSPIWKSHATTLAFQRAATIVNADLVKAAKGARVRELEALVALLEENHERGVRLVGNTPGRALPKRAWRSGAGELVTARHEYAEEAFSFLSAPQRRNNAAR